VAEVDEDKLRLAFNGPCELAGSRGRVHGPKALALYDRRNGRA
jgi:hypothetical protein